MATAKLIAPPVPPPEMVALTMTQEEAQAVYELVSVNCSTGEHYSQRMQNILTTHKASRDAIYRALCALGYRNR